MEEDPAQGGLEAAHARGEGRRERSTGAGGLCQMLD